MKRHSFVLTLLALFCCSFAFGQQRNCKTMDHLEYQRTIDPKVDGRMAKIQQFTNDFVKNNPTGKLNAVVQIPIVFHVIYNTNAENISDAQVLSQLQVLNDDFRRLNSDANNTWSQAADTEIEFCLATVDPSGNPTSGITRTQTSVTSFGTNDAMKYSSQGGVDAWDRDSYLNYWVCTIGGGILGYAQFPGGSAATDGVVCDSKYTGTTGTAQAPFNLGRTGTHEVGHWLNLRHIWGDGNCNQDDFVSDTPASDGANYGCASTHTSCNTLDMVQNYMDYSDDACMNLYTAGQKARMQALFAAGGARASLLNSTACGPAPDPTCNDGIQNQGEEGVDCGGPCTAVCPTCDDQTQNGDEEGVDCGGSSCQPCPCDGSSATLTLITDNYGSETTWTLTDASGATVGSGGPYANNTTITEVFCLADGCYDFTINDSYGDGICCSYGTGSYEITANGAVQVSGGEFASSETKNFCLTTTNDPCANAGGDADGDGVCANADCNDNDASVGAQQNPGTSCDDGDPNTTGDVILNDGCSCAGTVQPGPCDNAGGDADGDGVCADADCNDNDPAVGAGQNPGTACNDGDPSTENDTVGSDGCSCAGTPIPCFNAGGDADGDGVCAQVDCNDNDSSVGAGQNPGTACNDNDPTTNNDQIQADGCTCAGTPDNGVCTDVIIDATSFDTWGIWNDGGTDVRRSANDAAYATTGNYCVRLRDNSGSASATTTDPLDLSAFEDLTIDYSFYARSMENNEDFFIEISRGNGWEVVANYARGTDFNNDTYYSGSEYVVGPFSSSTQVRFRCDASGNSDWIYLDDVILGGCSNGAKIDIVNAEYVNPSVGFTLADGSVPQLADDKERLQQDTEIITDLTIFPNPAKDNLTVAFDLKDAAKVELSVMSVTGKVLQNRQIEGTLGMQQVKVDASDLTPGYYFVQLISNGEAKADKFVIVR